MKKTLAVLVVLCSPVVFAQQQPTVATTKAVQRLQAPTYADMYCSGFITNKDVGKGSYVIAGAESPHASEFVQGETIFLEGGSYQEGTRLSVLRELHDPNQSPAFAGQTAAVSAVGQPYATLGYVRVAAVRGKTAVAKVEYSCAPMVKGDIVVPFQEKPALAVRHETTFERFPAEKGSVTARIVLAKDFDYLLGTGHKVYISAGANKGVKPGDSFRAVRGYDPATMDPVDRLSYEARQGEETQKHPITVTKADYSHLPKRAVAELVVLDVTPTASTAMITYALETVLVGDTVELEGGGQH